MQRRCADDPRLRSLARGPRGSVTYGVPNAAPEPASVPELAVVGSLPAVATRMYLAHTGQRFLVPIEPPDRCSPDHLDQREIDLAVLGGAPIGHIFYCTQGCYRGYPGNVGMWRWTGRTVVPFDSAPRARSWRDNIETLMRGRTPEEAEAGRAALARRAARRVRASP